MRKALLASVVAFGVVLAPRIASAQLVVACPECDKEWTQLVSWIKSLVNEAQQLANQTTQITNQGRQIAEAVRTYDELVMAYQAITGVRDVGSAISALGALGIRNPLPSSAYAVQNLVGGQGGAAGTLGSLSTIFNTTLAGNAVYIPPGSDWRAQQMALNANSLAGLQSLAQQSYQAASDRLAQQPGIRTRLAAATTLKDVADVHAQIAATQSDAQAQQLQAANIQTQALVQPLVQRQRDAENDRLIVCRYLAYLAGGTDGHVAAPNCASAVPSTGGFQLASYTGGAVGGVSAGGGGALGVMMATAWGSDAANNATALGVNPEALAATCILESGCQNVEGSGTVSGPFQMTDATYSADLAKALAASPDLASVATGGKMDPATQSIAAAQDLHTAAIGLQAAGIANPTVLDARGAYNFGAAYGVPLATASDDQTMSSIVTALTPAQLQANGVTPGMTVGQWRASITSKLGASASAPILARST